jgi:hypothetical protein
MNSLSAQNDTSSSNSSDSTNSALPSLRQAGQGTLVAVMTATGIYILRCLFNCCIKRRIKKKVARLDIEELIIDIKKIVENIVKKISRTATRQRAPARDYLFATGKNAAAEIKSASPAKIQEIKKKY